MILRQQNWIVEIALGCQSRIKGLGSAPLRDRPRIGAPLVSAVSAFQNKLILGLCGTILFISDGCDAVMKANCLRTCLVLLIIGLLGVSSDFLDLLATSGRSDAVESAKQPVRSQTTDEDAPSGIPVAGMGVLVEEVTPSTLLIQVRSPSHPKLFPGDVVVRPEIVQFELTDDQLGGQQ